MARTVSQWATEFDDYWANHSTYGKADALSRANSANANQEFYFLSYHVEGLIKIWQATGDSKYLEDLMEIIHITINNSQPIGNYYGWPADSRPEGYALWDSYYWRHVASLTRIMFQSPNLRATSNGRGGTYEDDYQTILDFGLTNIWDRYEAETIGNIYRKRTHMASHWARIGMEFHIITGIQKYRDVFDNISFAGFPSNTSRPGDNLRNQLRANSQAAAGYEWNAEWDINDPNSNVQDMSHAGAIISFWDQAYRNGYYWDANDIAALIVTLNEVELTGSNHLLYENVDGSGGLVTTKGRGHEWMVLGQYDQTLQDKIDNNYVQGSNEHNLGYFGVEILGIMGYNQKVLTDSVPVYPESPGDPGTPPLPPISGSTDNSSLLMII